MPRPSLYIIQRNSMRNVLPRTSVQELFFAVRCVCVRQGCHGATDRWGGMFKSNAIHLFRPGTGYFGHGSVHNCHQCMLISLTRNILGSLSWGIPAVESRTVSTSWVNIGQILRDKVQMTYVNSKFEPTSATNHVHLTRNVSCVYWGI